MFKEGRFYKYLLLVGSIIISLFLIELLLRIIKFDYNPLLITAVEENDSREFLAFELGSELIDDRVFSYDPVLLWRPNVDFLVPIFNRQGFRGDVIDDTNAHYYKILALGDSNTLGMVVGYDWPRYLGESLKKDNGEIMVINAGIWGYSSYQGLQRFKEMLSFKPDMVLISFGSNDAHLVFTPDKKWSKQSLVMSKFLNKFKLYHLAMAVSMEASVAINKQLNAGLVHRVSPGEYRKNLLEIVSLARQHDIIPILLTRPFTGTSHNSLWWKNFAPEYNDIVMEVARENNVDYLDVYSFFRDKENLFGDESHFNPGGNKVMAELVYEHINKYINTPNEKE